MKKEYQYKTTGNCRAESVVQGKDWRFTVLTAAESFPKIVYLLFWEAKTVHHFSRGISVWMRTILKEQRVLWTVQTEHALWRTE